MQKQNYFQIVYANCENEKCVQFMFGVPQCKKKEYKGWICKRPIKPSNQRKQKEKKRKKKKT